MRNSILAAVLIASSSVSCSSATTTGITAGTSAAAIASAGSEQHVSGVPGGQSDLSAKLRPEVERFAAALAENADDGEVDSGGPEVSLFSSVLTLTVVNYVDPVDSSVLVDAAIAGMDEVSGGNAAGDLASLVDAAIVAMVGSLDDRSAYLHPGLIKDARMDPKPDPADVSSLADARMYEGRIAYLRLVRFQEGTAREVDTALDTLMDASKPRTLEGLVLDLRSNQGGLLNEAFKVADLFLRGLIVYTEGRVQKQRHRFIGLDDPDEPDMPMVVLVNAETASGAEILAAALQDHKRARIVGTHTSGAGTVQTLLPLTREVALRITTARAYSPAGHPIDNGVEPDLPLDDEPAGVATGEDAFLARALAELRTP